MIPIIQNGRSSLLQSFITYAHGSLDLARVLFAFVSFPVSQFYLDVVLISCSILRGYTTGPGTHITRDEYELRLWKLFQRYGGEARLVGKTKAGKAVPEKTFEYNCKLYDIRLRNMVIQLVLSEPHHLQLGDQFLKTPDSHLVIVAHPLPPFDEVLSSSGQNQLFGIRYPVSRGQECSFEVPTAYIAAMFADAMEREGRIQVCSSGTCNA